MTIVLALRGIVYSKATTRTPHLIPKRPQKLNLQLIRPAYATRTMNTLQEASRIYKAFQKGGPTFGGWQVPSFILFILHLYD
jgi:hypothetical protein